MSHPGGDAALKHCLGAVGKPVAQSAGSTLLTVALVASTDSYVLNSFATIVCLAILYGAIHGLIILPALLHSFAPSSCRNQAGLRPSLALFFLLTLSCKKYLFGALFMILL